MAQPRPEPLVICEIRDQPRKIRRSIRAQNRLVWTPPELIDQQRRRYDGESIGERFDDFERYSGREPSRCDEDFAALIPLPQLVHLSDDFNTEVLVLMESVRTVVADDIKNIMNAP